MEMIQILVYILVLVVGKTPADRKEFGRLRGEWRVVALEERGKPAPLKEIGSQSVVIASSTEAVVQKHDGLLLSGRLIAAHRRHAMEFSALTVLPPWPKGGTPAPPTGPTKIPKSMYAYYALQGETLKLLLTPVRSKDTAGPARLKTEAGSDAMLFTLRRK